MNKAELGCINIKIGVELAEWKFNNKLKKYILKKYTKNYIFVHDSESESKWVHLQELYNDLREKRAINSLYFCSSDLIISTTAVSKI